MVNLEVYIGVRSGITMSTRSQSRLEEQMEMLIAKMDQQSEQLQQLSIQQSERVESVVEKLNETDKHVEALAGDLDSVKSAVHGRLGDMEESMTSMKTLQAEFGERQKSLRVELRDELLRELSANVKTSLRPTAPSFVLGPTVGGGEGAAILGYDGTGGDSADGRGSGGGATPGDRGGTTGGAGSQKPAPFDGKLTWDAYHTQFEMLAQINRWSDADKAAYLVISLRGPAATVLTNLPPAQRYNYAALTSALQSQFGTAHQTELNRMRLKARIRRREETLPELAEDVERLVRLAYPDATEPMVEVLAKDQFVNSLPEEDMRLRIRQHRPATLRAALETALELESYQLTSRQRARFVREVQLEKEHTVQQQVFQSGAKGTVATGDDILQQIVDVLHRCC